VKSAILATDSTIVHYARLLILLTQSSSIKIQVFQDRKDAAQWLGVPIELLAPDDRGGKRTDNINSTMKRRSKT
jgi:hypothetical protein